jgi:uncharacterized protein YndB with AHSA1/START domain
MTTPDLHIAREVDIDAPIEVVWRTITEPDQIRLWFADRAEIALAPGGSGVLGFEERAFPFVVEAVDPYTRFSYRWNHPAGEQPAAGNSTLVEFTLTRVGERTRLRVVESGLDLLNWTDADKRHFADDHRAGWAMYLGRLATLLADRSAA